MVGELNSQEPIKIWLGYEDEDYKRSLDNWDDRVFWIPQKEINQHMLISGCSGSGKTETLKVICCELKKNGIPLLIFDFHNDFGEFADYVVNEENIKIHPLQILKGEKPIDVVYKVSAILKNSFKDLTVIQEGVIRKAIIKFYEDSGITDLHKVNDGSYKILPFRKFRKYFAEVTSDERTVKSLEIKLDILFDYEVFANADESSINFNDLLKRNTVFQLKHAPSDNVKKVVTELMINKLIQYSYTLEQTKKLRLYCIIDEAHRMAYNGSPIDKLFREARKYGIGIILASQRSTDFDETLLSNTGTVITLKQNLMKDALHISKNLWARKDTLLRLRPGQGYIKFSTDQQPKLIQIVSCEDRKE